MMNLRPDHVFRSLAFEPSQDEVRNALRRADNARRRVAPAAPSHPALKKFARSQREIEELIELSWSSDEDLPDVAELLSAAASSSPKGKGKVVKDEGEDDNVSNNFHVQRMANHICHQNTDADLTMDEIRGKGKARRQGRDSSEQPHGMSDHLIATWKRGDNNLEPSTKMLALAEHLQEWESTGDKTIVFSQCT